MPSGRFSKQAAPFITQKYLNSGVGDAVIGGALAGAPAGVTGVSQFEQNIPGDRFILSPLDALALSNNNVGTLYTGIYSYVATKNNSTSIPQRGRAAFWDLVPVGANNNGTDLADSYYQVTSDEAANIGVALLAGVFINNITQGNYWFIQTSGKITCQFRTTLTGTPAIGCGVYLAAASSSNSNATVGLFDVLTGANAGTTFSAANGTAGYTAIDNMFVRYVGPAEQIPSNNNFSLVDVNMWRNYRW